jgi:hypothetical protein
MRSNMKIESASNTLNTIRLTSPDRVSPNANCLSYIKTQQFHLNNSYILSFCYHNSYYPIKLNFQAGIVKSKI